MRPLIALAVLCYGLSALALEFRTPEGVAGRADDLGCGVWRVRLAAADGQFAERGAVQALAAFMARRAPGHDALSTARRESDEVLFTSGFGSDGVTDGGDICGEIANRDARPGDYGRERTVPRPGHADFGQWIESGAIPTGGGKNSGRLTAPLCAAGGIALQMLEERGILIGAHIRSIGTAEADGSFDPVRVGPADFVQIHRNGFPVLNP